MSASGPPVPDGFTRGPVTLSPGRLFRALVAADADDDVVVGARMEGPEVKAEIGAEITTGLGEGVREEGNELAGLGSVVDFVSWWW